LIRNGPLGRAPLPHLGLQPIRRQAEALEQLRSHTGIPAHGHQHVGHLNQARSPERTLAIRLLQQIFKVVTDEQLIAAGHGLIRQKTLQAVEQLLWIQAEGSHQVAITSIAEQHLQQMLHIQLAVAPTTRQILAGKE
jgi:hypothetical protein